MGLILQEAADTDGERCGGGFSLDAGNAVSRRETTDGLQISFSNVMFVPWDGLLGISEFSLKKKKKTILTHTSDALGVGSSGRLR